MNNITLKEINTTAILKIRATLSVKIGNLIVRPLKEVSSHSSKIVCSCEIISVSNTNKIGIRENSINAAIAGALI